MYGSRKTSSFPPRRTHGRAVKEVGCSVPATYISWAAMEWLAVFALSLALRYFTGDPILGWQEEIIFQSLVVSMIIICRSCRLPLKFRLETWVVEAVIVMVAFSIFAKTVADASMALWGGYLLTSLFFILGGTVVFLSSELFLCAIRSMKKDDWWIVHKMLGVKRKSHLKREMAVLLFAALIVWPIALGVDWMQKHYVPFFPSSMCYALSVTLGFSPLFMAASCSFYWSKVGFLSEKASGEM